MKVLIIGARGFLGKELVKDFSKGNEVFGADQYENIEELYYLDLLKRDLVKETFARVKPEIVLLPAAITGVDFCEKNQDVAWKVNTEGPKEIAVAVKKQGAFLAFYSTDYIFDGKNGPYSEEAKPNPINFYGKTKLEAERIIAKELKEFLIIRTCSLYGYEKNGKNFAMQVLTNLGAKKAMRVPDDQFGTPAYVEDLSGIALKLINMRKEGIFNAVSQDCINRVKFAQEIADVFNLDKGLITAVRTEELSQAAERPKKGGLKVDKLIKETGIVPMSLREGLLAMTKRINKE